ncbi:MAG: hypothetical protein KDA55_15185, partial [Planctomycetales bacterium]|nr:hypothetical protein [Planctomycetales bacterium]
FARARDAHQYLRRPASAEAVDQFANRFRLIASRFVWSVDAKFQGCDSKLKRGKISGERAASEPMGGGSGILE